MAGSFVLLYLCLFVLIREQAQEGPYVLGWGGRSVEAGRNPFTRRNTALLRLYFSYSFFVCLNALLFLFYQKLCYFLLLHITISSPTPTVPVHPPTSSPALNAHNPRHARVTSRTLLARMGTSRASAKVATWKHRTIHCPLLADQAHILLHASTFSLSCRCCYCCCCRRGGGGRWAPAEATALVFVTLLIPLLLLLLLLQHRAHLLLLNNLLP